jgi:hypothetical protein
MSKINIYLICEGTSCDFIEKSIKSKSHISRYHSSISDYGLFESYYFNNNSNNTKYFNDDNSIYLTSTKHSCIDSALIIYGNNNENRKLYPIPYTSRNIQSLSGLRNLMDEFGSEQNINNYIKQNKFSEFSSYLPSYNVRLDWTHKSSNVNDYTVSVKKFLDFIQKITEKEKNIENVFLVCEAPFIVNMMNLTSRNKYSSKDMIEHTSFWLFQYENTKQGFWNRLSAKITSRNKLYPLSRNHGLLQQYNKIYFYLYKDLRVPLFHFDKPIPSNYLKSKYLSLCKSIPNNNQRKDKIKNEKKEKEEKEMSGNSNHLKKILQKMRVNKFSS